MAKRQVALVWAVCLVAAAMGCHDCAGREEPAAEDVEDVEENIASIDWLVPTNLVPDPMDKRFFSTVAFDPVSALKGGSPAVDVGRFCG